VIIYVILSECRGREVASRAEVEALEVQLQSRQETQDFQEPIRDLEQRLSDMSTSITAIQSEIKTLDAEHEKALAMSSDELSHKTDKKERQR